MVWRSMGESILFSITLCAGLVYTLYSYGYIAGFETWLELVKRGAMLLVLAAGVGAAYGYWYSNGTKQRLEMLGDIMLLLEKGNLSRRVPYLGEDEVGRLGDQLNAISGKWEEQVSTLQRLSTNNAQLAEKAKLSAVVEERQRLARDLHDAVSQQLFAISMTATAVGRTLEKDYDKAVRQIHLIEEMAAVAQSEMRLCCCILDPFTWKEKRLSQGVIELLEEMRAKVPIDISWEMDDGIRLAKGIEDHLFRIVQEALSNALRHSKASKLESSCSIPRIPCGCL